MQMLEQYQRKKFIGISIKRSNLLKRSLHFQNKFKDTHSYDSGNIYNWCDIISDCIFKNVEESNLEYQQTVECILLSYSIKFTDFIRSNPNSDLKEIQSFTRKWVQEYLAPTTLSDNRPINDT